MNEPEHAPRPGTGDALLVVDVQNDFLPGGALAVQHGDEVVPVLDRWIRRFVAAGRPVVASRDWHPAAHCSFHEQGDPWPPHCVAGTSGAAWAPQLQLPESTLVVDKGTQPRREAYSAFQDTGLAATLREGVIRRLFLGGLATDYCVARTVEDALVEGFEVLVLRDAIRAVDVHPGDGAAAIRSMQERGAVLIAEPD